MENNEWPTIDRSRRDMLKKSAASLGLLAGTSSASLTVSATSDRPQAIDPRDDPEPNPDAPMMRIDDSLSVLDEHWILASSNRGQVIRYVRESSANDAEKDAAEERLKELWRTYPVKRVKDGRVTTLKLDENRAPKKVRSTNKNAVASQMVSALDEVAPIVSDGLRSYSSDGDLSIQWHPENHGDYAYWAGKNINIGESYSQDLEDYAPDPDYFSYNVSDEIPDEIEDLFGQIIHSYTHYYNPNPGFQSGPSGLAPAYAETDMYIARDNFSSDRATANQHLAYATHYLADVGQPLHTGMEFEQIAYSSVHYNYESAALDAFRNCNIAPDSGTWSIYDCLEDEIANLGSYYDCNVPAGHTISLANYASQYRSQVFYDTYNNPNDPLDSLMGVTENVVDRTEKYVMGFVAYLYY